MLTRKMISFFAAFAILAAGSAGAFAVGTDANSSATAKEKTVTAEPKAALPTLLDLSTPT